MEAFDNSTYEDESIVKPKSSFDPITKDKHLNEIVKKVEHTDSLRVKAKDNLKPSERQALTDLKTYDDIVIKKSGQG